MRFPSWFPSTMRTHLLVLWGLVLAGVASGAGVDFAHAPSAFAVVLTMAITAEAAKPKRDGEDEEYFDFYLACCILVLVIELCGGGYILSKDEVKWKHIAIVLVAGIRSFDMMSDWVRTVFFGRVPCTRTCRGPRASLMDSRPASTETVFWCVCVCVCMCACVCVRACWRACVRVCTSSELARGKVLHGVPPCVGLRACFCTRAS